MSEPLDLDALDLYVNANRKPNRGGPTMVSLPEDIVDALVARVRELEGEVAAFRKSNEDWKETAGEAFAEAEASKREARSWESNYADLKRWKSEAMPVMDGLQELGKALGVGLGRRCTGPEALAAVIDLRARLEAAERERDAYVKLHVDATERWHELDEQHTALRDSISKLADEWQQQCEMAGSLQFPPWTQHNLRALIRSDTGGQP